ncbi:hypothetical protein [Prauserella marina]|uniref:hypothetical protein n=1 Tax=Prauserella marina TaxID=530584 RepID=UPI00115FEFDA|nr:hypothetical protein [Prauserella marina]
MRESPAQVAEFCTQDAEIPTQVAEIRVLAVEICIQVVEIRIRTCEFGADVGDFRVGPAGSPPPPVHLARAIRARLAPAGPACGSRC